MSLGLAVVPAAASAASPPAAASPAGVNYSALLDEQLLARFFREREDAAFAALVERHGPLVYGVCRRVLRDTNDAQDAFQATFLVLVRKGKSLAQPKKLASWLFGVAYRTSRKVRARAATRTKYERNAKSQREASPMPAIADVDDMTLSELRAILDEEIASLPEKYALPLILCYLEGKSHVEAAAQLGWPDGSMSRRLARARELLKSRLMRRGLALSAALLAALFTKPLIACPPPALVQGTVAAGGLLLRGAPLKEVVTGPTAAVIGDVAGSVASGVKTTWAAIVAAAAVLLALGVAARQFGPVQGEERTMLSAFLPARWNPPVIREAEACTELLPCAQCPADGKRLANPPPPPPYPGN